MRFVFVVLVWVQIGCASSRMALVEADRNFREGNYEKAAEKLEKGLEKEGDGNDQLLFLLDLALAYHSSGQYEESNRYFFEADNVAEIKDYTNYAAEAATLLTSDNIKPYKGEDFENVLISVYLALNFALMGKKESALVEARRVNRKLHRMIHEGKRPYKQNAFARYLSGLLYEADQEWNDAYISYKKTHELNPSFPELGLDLWRMAWLTGIQEDLDRWVQEYELTPEQIKKTKEKGPGSGFSEIIVLYENGISPIKRPHPQFHSIPKFYPRANPVEFAEVWVDGEKKGQTTILENIEATAIHNLDEKYAGIIVKKLAGVVAKEVVGNQVAKGTDSPILGFLTKLALHASDQADVRSWNLLPRDLQVARIVVAPGKRTLQLKLVGSDREIPKKEFELKAGQKVFYNARFMP